MYKIRGDYSCIMNGMCSKFLLVYISLLSLLLADSRQFVNLVKNLSLHGKYIVTLNWLGLGACKVKVHKPTI